MITSPLSTTIKIPLSGVFWVGQSFRDTFLGLTALTMPNTLFAQTSFFLPSRTTIIAEANLGFKLYRTPTMTAVRWAREEGGKKRNVSQVSLRQQA
jgi:hypothetical protein